MKAEKQTRTRTYFLTALILVIAIFAASVIKTELFNAKMHQAVYTGASLFTAEDSGADLSVQAVPRSSTWGKIFDFNNEGLTENNYQAYTYDFTFSNNTRDEVESFTFQLTFSEETFLASGWNGAVEIHQKLNGGEVVSLVPDLREYKKENHPLTTITVDGETFIRMQPGDYFIYIPSSTTNAMEVPINAHEGTTAGFILYVENGKTIEGSSMELDYKLHRLLTSEPLFWISIALLTAWLISLIIFAGTPPTSEFDGTSFVTTAPAATTQWLPIVTPGSITALAPIHTSSPMTTALVDTPCSSILLEESLKL